MKRTFLMVLPAVAFCLAGLWWLSKPAAYPKPRYEVLSESFKFPEFSHLTYQFLDQRPFQGGKMWLTVFGVGSAGTFYVDLTSGKVLGKLSMADPICTTADGAQVLCSTRLSGSNSARSLQLLRQVMLALTGRNPARYNDDLETLWLVDLKSGAVKKVGSLPQPKFYTRYFPSPGFNYAYNQASARPSPGELTLCDLQKETLYRLKANGWASGWWSDTEIVMKDDANNFVLFDVTSRKSKPLFTEAEISQAFAQAELTEPLSRANMFCSWNGAQNDFYLTDTHKRWQAAECYLFKVLRGPAAPKLSLVSTNFKFEWSDHFTEDAKGYVYSGREAGEASSGVFFRDLQSNNVRTLVPSDGSRLFSLPNLYSGKVIYVRSNQICQVKLDGSNSRPLFPPAGN